MNSLHYNFLVLPKKFYWFYKKRGWTSWYDFFGIEKIKYPEYNKALGLNSDLIIFSEMSICGYPCEDLWLKNYFIEACKVKIIQLMNYSKNKSCAIIIGSPTFGEERKKRVLRNSALLIENGELIRIINKKSLPNYGVFDENRYFSANPNLSIVEFRGYDLAIMICEDFWDERNLFLLIIYRIIK
jgi:predicted amidohydrolase